LLAVDAGVHLAAIKNLLDTHSVVPSSENPDKGGVLTDGPFHGLQVPHNTSKANAAFITNTMISTFLITHPHLDHIAGFVINTAGLPGPNSRPKRLAGLPKTIEAFRKHIFNDVIWPNLSDENLGAGLVTYMRLLEGGSAAMGDGDSLGYLEISEGLSVKAWGISHGSVCDPTPKPIDSRRDSLASLNSATQQAEPPPRRLPRSGSQQLLGSPRSGPQQLHQSARHGSVSTHTPAHSPAETLHHDQTDCVYDSSVYFIRDIITGREILIFGDVEPDSISHNPRNWRIWQQAAPVIAAKRLQGIFIECSFDDSQHEDRLYGHMTPRFLINELKVLAKEVEESRGGMAKDGKEKKRKRMSDGLSSSRRTTRKSTMVEAAVSPLSQPPHRPGSYVIGDVDNEVESPSEELEGFPIRSKMELPLKGLKIIIIHVKDKLADGPEMGDLIMAELLEHEKEARLGCEFMLSSTGQSVFL
jgi:cAMP phosphodiesterase